MKYFIIVLELACVLFFCSCKIDHKEKTQFADLQKKYQAVINEKYQRIDNDDKLLFAVDMFLKENYAAHKNNVADEIGSSNYRYEEKTHLLKQLNAVIDRHPDVVVQTLIRFYQYAGAADEELVIESLRKYFNRNPAEFIKAISKQKLMTCLEPEFANIDFIEKTIYPSLSEPLSEEYLKLSPTLQKAYTINKIKGLDSHNDFYVFLKKQYQLK
jgi:hypothetical protein